jgi:cellulose synthase/poly-beta-1,6-N-acetylglucosamine synthase-like glycosyltransferase
MAPERPSGVFSIIIPALNEERVIGRCLQALTRLDLPGYSFEVVLVDNGSTDRTIEIAKSFSSELNLIVLSKPGARISAMRNYGVSKTKGEFLAFLDADCVAPPDWLKTAPSRLAQDGVGVLGAHYRIPDDSRWVGRAWYGGLELELQGRIDWVPAGDMIIARSTFDRIGGFDESIQTNEDCELCERTRAAGLQVVGDAAVAVVHLGTPQTVAHFYRKIRWHATDAARVFFRSLPKITNPRPLLFACYTMLCLAGAAIGAAMAAWSRMFGVLAFFSAALLIPALLLSIRVAFRRRNWTIVVPLTVLHLAFGLARGEALLRTLGRRRAD